MFFYPEKMDAVDTECVRQAACEHEGRNTHFINMQGTSKTREAVSAGVQLLVGLQTTDSPLAGLKRTWKSHRKSRCIFKHTFKILTTSWFGVLEEAWLDPSFWWKVCLPLSGTGTESSRLSLVAESSPLMRGNSLNQSWHSSVGWVR